jgi:hypothetical protein
MKMTLDQLKVDSYSSTVSEKELTEIKGGTAWWCVAVEVAAAVIIAVVTSGDSGSSETPETPETPTPPQN